MAPGQTTPASSVTETIDPGVVIIATYAATEESGIHLMLIETVSCGAEKSNVTTSPYSPEGVEELGMVGLIDNCFWIDLFVSVIFGVG